MFPALVLRNLWSFPFEGFPCAITQFNSGRPVNGLMRWSSGFDGKDTKFCRTGALQDQGIGPLKLRALYFGNLQFNSVHSLICAVFRLSNEASDSGPDYTLMILNGLRLWIWHHTSWDTEQLVTWQLRLRVYSAIPFEWDIHDIQVYKMELTVWNYWIVCAGSVMFVSIIVSFLILIPLTLSVPQSPCHRCCDEDSLPYEAPTTLPPDTPAMPEIRMYINMTILKGNLNVSPFGI